MFTRNQRNPTISVLLLGGTNDHSLTIAPMLAKEIVVTGQQYGKREKYKRTREVRSVRGTDGVVSSYRVYEYSEDVKR